MNHHIITKWLCCFILFQLGSFSLEAQWEGIIYDDTIYQENIHTVKFHINGFPLTQPILDLDSRVTLELSSDDIGADLSNYYYCLLYTAPSPRDATLSRMPSSA